MGNRMFLYFNIFTLIISFGFTQDQVELEINYINYDNEFRIFGYYSLYQIIEEEDSLIYHYYSTDENAERPLLTVGEKYKIEAHIEADGLDFLNWFDNNLNIEFEDDDKYELAFIIDDVGSVPSTVMYSAFYKQTEQIDYILATYPFEVEIHDPWYRYSDEEYVPYNEWVLNTESEVFTNLDDSYEKYSIRYKQTISTDTAIYQMDNFTWSGIEYHLTDELVNGYITMEIDFLEPPIWLEFNYFLQHNTENSNIIIQSGDVLEIPANANIPLAENVEINVYGKMIMNEGSSLSLMQNCDINIHNSLEITGTENNPVTFDSNDGISGFTISPIANVEIIHSDFTDIRFSVSPLIESEVDTNPLNTINLSESKFGFYFGIHNIVHSDGCATTINIDNCELENFSSWNTTSPIIVSNSEILQVLIFNYSLGHIIIDNNTLKGLINMNKTVDSEIHHNLIIDNSSWDTGILISDNYIELDDSVLRERVGNQSFEVIIENDEQLNELLEEYLLKGHD